MYKSKKAPTALQSGMAWVYVAYSDRINGDSFDVAHTFYLTSARAALSQEIHHMTASELANTSNYISGWQFHVEAGETAKDAFYRWIDDQFELPSPEFYESFNE